MYSQKVDSGSFSRGGGRIVKFAISIVLLMLVASNVKVPDLIQLIGNVNLGIILLAIFITLAQTLILSWRWHRIIGFLEGNLDIGVAVRLSFLGVFMNQVLPTSIGGDLFRVWGAHRYGLVSSIGFTSVVIDRVTGLLALSLVVTLSALIVWGELDDPFLRLVILCSSPMLLALLVLCVLVDKKKFQFLNHHVVRLFADFAGGMRKLASNLSGVSEILILGALASLVGWLAVFVLGQSIGIEVSIVTSIALVGAVTLLSALPVSLGGWGVREVSMIALLGIVGVPNEKSFLLSVLYGGVMVLASLPGGFLWWGDRALAKTQVADAQLVHHGQRESVQAGYWFSRFKAHIFSEFNRLVDAVISLISVVGVSKFWKWLYLIFLSSLIISVVIVGPVIGGDSSTYENHWPTRSPVYPYLLDIFDRHYLLLVIFQVLLGLASVFFFCNKLRSILSLSPYIHLAVLMLLLLPYFPVGGWGVGNYVGTESVSYSLFLFSIGYFISGFVKGDKNDIIVSCLILLVLMLTRKQFLFVYPVYVLMLLFIRNWSKSMLLICIVFASYFGGNAVERIYNGVTAGHYTGIPFTGMQLVIRPLWISHQTDAERFVGVEKEIFLSTLKSMGAVKVSLESCKDDSLPIQCGYHHFLESYNIICWQILYPTLRHYGVTDWWEIDRITLSISAEIIKSHWFVYLSEYYSAIKNGDGPYYMAILIVVLLWSLIESKKHNSVEAKIALMITLMSLGNIFLVSIVEPLLQRYTFYTSFLQIAFLVILISKRDDYRCVE